MDPAAKERVPTPAYGRYPFSLLSNPTPSVEEKKAPIKTKKGQVDRQTPFETLPPHARPGLGGRSRNTWSTRAPPQRSSMGSGNLAALNPAANEGRGRFELISRRGTRLGYFEGIRTDLARLERALNPRRPSPPIFDGRIYSHVVPFNAIWGAARTTKHLSAYDEVLVYHLFDLVDLAQPELSYLKRMDLLEAGFAAFSGKAPLSQPPSPGSSGWGTDNSPPSPRSPRPTPTLFRPGFEGHPAQSRQQIRV